MDQEKGQQHQQRKQHLIASRTSAVVASTSPRRRAGGFTMSAAVRKELALDQNTSAVSTTEAATSTRFAGVAATGLFEFVFSTQKILVILW